MEQMNEAHQNHELSEPAPGQNEARFTSLTKPQSLLYKRATLAYGYDPFISLRSFIDHV